jgi:hypothetical protein
MFIAAVAPVHRANVARALHGAVQAEYPRFFSAQELRLSKILEKGRISSESQFTLARHTIDVLEGVEHEQCRLQKLYQLVGEFEARASRK